VSSHINIKNIEVLVDNIVRKGVAYAVGLITFLHAVDFRRSNVIDTLKPAFGATVAEKVYDDLDEAFRNIDIYTKVVIEGREVWLSDYLRQRVLREDIIRVILGEVKKRLQYMPEEDRKILSVASAIITVLKTKSYPAVGVYVRYPSEINGIRVGSIDGEYFSKLVSSVLGIDIPDVRIFFCRYLLGFIDDSASRKYYYYALEIYSFAIPYIEEFAESVSKYITIYDRSSIKSKLYELYQKGELAKLAVIKRSLSTREASEFLSQFFGKPYEQLCNEVVIESIIRKCFINPLVYEHVKEALYELYNEALSELITMFKNVFKEEGYSVSCFGEYCIITKTPFRPMYIYFYPWPVDMLTLEDFAGAVKAIVIQGIPTQSILQAQVLQSYGSRGYLWLFVEKNKVVIALNTYRHEDHYELLNILKKHFALEVMGSGLIPKEIKRLGAKDILEDVVASALKSLGFYITVDYRITTRAGTEIEVDVWGEKSIGDMKFVVYASCKNWDRPVEVSVVREEFGRILQLRYIPHVRIIVAPVFAESAKMEALANGFVVIETDEKATEENLEKVYQKVYEKLNKLFMGVAPMWMQELAEKTKSLAEKARSMADEIKRLSEELEEAAGIR